MSVIIDKASEARKKQDQYTLRIQQMSKRDLQG